MTCALCQALRRPLPAKARTWLEDREARLQAKRERRWDGSNPPPPTTTPKPSPPPNPPPQDVQ